MAAQLVDLGVDILEAGFPIASEGDFEAVDAVSRAVSLGAGGGAGARCTLRRGAGGQGACNMPGGRASTPSSPPATFI